VKYFLSLHTVCCKKIMMKEFFIPKGIKPSRKMHVVVLLQAISLFLSSVKVELVTL